MYIGIEDIEILLRTEVKDILLQDNDNLLLDLNQSTESFIASYIGNKYDIAYEFSLTEDERNKFMLRLAIDILAYDAYTRMSIEIIPEIREVRYNDAISTLMKITKGEINPLIKLKDTEVDESTSPFISYGSNTKNNTQW